MRSPLHLGSPRGADHRQADLGEHPVDHGVEDLLLVGDVVVDRHRAHSQLAGDPADRHRPGPDPVGHLDGGIHDAVLVQACVGSSRHVAHMMRVSGRYS
jgi:hypothetical protein